MKEISQTSKQMKNQIKIDMCVQWKNVIILPTLKGLKQVDMIFEN